MCDNLYFVIVRSNYESDDTNIRHLYVIRMTFSASLVLGRYNWTLVTVE